MVEKNRDIEEIYNMANVALQKRGVSEMVEIISGQTDSHGKNDKDKAIQDEIETDYEIISAVLQINGPAAAVRTLIRLRGQPQSTKRY